MLPGETTLFQRGLACPTFAAGPLRFGINICSDAQAAELAQRVAGQGARMLLLPVQNMLRRATAAQWQDRHQLIRAQRARETGVWVISAHVAGERDETRIAYGTSSIIDPSGDIVAELPPMTTGMIVADVR